MYAWRGRGSPGFAEVFILEKVKVVCFDALLQVLILKIVRRDRFLNPLGTSAPPSADGDALKAHPYKSCIDTDSCRERRRCRGLGPTSLPLKILSRKRKGGRDAAAVGAQILTEVMIPR